MRRGRRYHLSSTTWRAVLNKLYSTCRDHPKRIERVQYTPCPHHPRPSGHSPRLACFVSRNPEVPRTQPNPTQPYPTLPYPTLPCPANIDVLRLFSTWSRQVFGARRLATSSRQRQDLARQPSPHQGRLGRLGRLRGGYHPLGARIRPDADGRRGLLVVGMGRGGASVCSLAWACSVCISRTVRGFVPV